MEDFQTDKNIEEKPDAIVSAMLYPAIELEKKIQDSAKKINTFYLRAHLNRSQCFIGPWVFPDEKGCIICCENRLKTVYPTKGIWERHREKEQQESYVKAKKPWSYPFLDFIASIIVNEILSLESGKSLKLFQSVYVASDWKIEGKIHSFYPDSLCPVCGDASTDEMESMNLEFNSCIKPHPKIYRLPNEHLNEMNLRSKFVDWRTGIIFHLYRESLSTIIPMVGAEMRLPNRNNTEIGFGRTLNYKESEVTAILEALERYVGMTPRGKRTMMYGSYKKFQSQAIHPTLFGLHDPEQYHEPGYNYVSYNDDLEFNWIWAYSWKKQEPVLIPEQLVYYQDREIHGRPTNRFCYETSNGCSMGATLEEAVFHALLEVIERDAFLVSWYNRLPLQELSLEDVDNQEILLIQSQFESLGYHLHVFDMTMESGIPSIWALAINQSDEGVKTYTAAGAHPDPEKAILSAILEVVTSMQIYENSLPNQRELAFQMTENKSLVQKMYDHIVLYSHPKAVKRFQFLFQDDKPPKLVKSVFPKWYKDTPPSDLLQELKKLIERILIHNFDVLIVDQTTEELEQIGVKAVKVLVPGMLTMSFGHQYRRIILNRVKNIPVILGYRHSPITEDELNLDPHPFP